MDGKTDQFPARVSRQDADWFCQILSENTGFKFRLPTEAEWEYACRAGTTTAYFTGTSITNAHANFNAQIEGSRVGMQEVASVLPNPWGLYDMLGNEFEWCSDWEGTYPAGDVIDPTGPENTPERNQPRTTYRNIIRGGNYSSTWKYIRSAYRYDYTPHVPFGFRLIMELPEE